MQAHRRKACHLPINRPVLCSQRRAETIYSGDIYKNRLFLNVRLKDE